VPDQKGSSGEIRACLQLPGAAGRIAMLIKLAAILKVPQRRGRQPRPETARSGDGVWVADITGLLSQVRWPTGMRVIVRKGTAPSRRRQLPRAAPARWPSSSAQPAIESAVSGSA
jgi:hypothetical protein